MSTIQTLINKISGKTITKENDILAVEEPLEIRLSFIKEFQRQVKSLSVTMRTPGNDEELALGFLFTEGIIESIDQVLSSDTSVNNIITITFREDVSFEMKKLEKHFYTSSSCGVCGKTSIDAIHTLRNPANEAGNLKVNTSVLYNLSATLRQKQNIFEQTGGLHASAIFDTNGELILLNEDVGRHNALDKLIGSALKKNLVPLENYILLLSGRASFELIQKATMAGIQIVASVGAPSSLAVDLAKERKMTLIGFLKSERFNVYTGLERLSL